MFRIVFFFSLVVVFVVNNCYAEQVNSSSKIKVGVIFPLSGDAASLGESIKNGFLLGMEKLPQAVRDRIQVFFEDDGLSPKNSISAFNKLTNGEGIDILLNVSSGTAKALSPLAEKKRIPFLAIGASDKRVSEGKKYVFNFWIIPETEAQTLISEARRRGYRRIAAITAVQDGELAIKAAFDKLNNGQLEVVLDEEFAPESKDFKSFLTRLRGIKDVDGVMIVLMPGQCGLFAKQARQMGFKKDLFGFEMFEDTAEVKTSAGALVGQWYVNADDASKTFIDEFRQRFPSSSLLGAAHGYEAALLLGDGIRKGFDGKNFNEYFATVKDFSGVLGTYSATGDNRFALPVAVKVVTENGFEKVR